MLCVVYASTFWGVGPLCKAQIRWYIFIIRTIESILFVFFVINELLLQISLALSYLWLCFCSFSFWWRIISKWIVTCFLFLISSCFIVFLVFLCSPRHLPPILSHLLLHWYSGILLLSWLILISSLIIARTGTVRWIHYKIICNSLYSRELY